MTYSYRRMRLSNDSRHRLNTVCPYYTMFPLEFPMNLLRNKAKSLVVMDPFCGRGTTNYAARFLGLRSYGFDTSPVAIAIAKAKLATSTTAIVTKLANRYLNEPAKYNVPTGEFWRRAYHPSTLDEICRIRSRLLLAKSGDAVHLLRAVMLGAMHGPLSRDIRNASYLSNQMPRTFAAKPAYAANYWKDREMQPPRINAIEIIKKRVNAALRFTNPSALGPTAIQRGDATKWGTFSKVDEAVDLIITSPPYYGLRTYIEDQWLRQWFLGGPANVSYGGHQQINHSSPEQFSADLARVWDNVASVGGSDLRMVVRFGSIGSRSAEPGGILRRSLKVSAWDWQIRRSRACGTAADGKRQADLMVKDSAPRQERDYFISLRI